MDIKLNISKSEFFLAFDEFITSNSEFEGNSCMRALEEINVLLESLISDEIFYDDINRDLLTNFLNIFTIPLIRCFTYSNGYNGDNEINMILSFFNPVSKYKSFGIDESIEPILNKDKMYFLAGWIEHAILIFYERVTEDNYIVGVINAGSGTSIQGYSDNLCNGIIIFKNITFEKIITFMNRYREHLLRSQSNNYNEERRYYLIYDIICITLLNIGETTPGTSHTINFFDLIEKGLIVVYHVNRQVTGNCTFINVMYYIVFMLIKKNIHNPLEIFNEWYKKAKKYAKKNIHKQIMTIYHLKNQKIREERNLETIQIMIDDLYNYVKKNKEIVLMINRSLMNNTRYKLEKNISGIIDGITVNFSIEEIEKDFLSGIHNKLLITNLVCSLNYISKNNDKIFSLDNIIFSITNTIYDFVLERGIVINKCTDLKSILWHKYYNSNFTVENIQQLLKILYIGTIDEAIEYFYHLNDAIKDLPDYNLMFANVVCLIFEFFNQLNMLDNGYYFLIPYIFLFELKDRGIFLSDELIIAINIFNPFPLQHCLLFNFGCLVSYIKDKRSMFVETSIIPTSPEYDEKKRIYYCSFMDKIPIIHGKYTIHTHKLLNMIMNNINYFPTIDIVNSLHINNSTDINETYTNKIFLLKRITDKKIFFISFVKKIDYDERYFYNHYINAMFTCLDNNFILNIYRPTITTIFKNRNCFAIEYKHPINANVDNFLLHSLNIDLSNNRQIKLYYDTLYSIKYSMSEIHTYQDNNLKLAYMSFNDMTRVEFDPNKYSDVLINLIRYLAENIVYGYECVYKYFIYFYLCEILNVSLNKIIFNKYDKYVTKLFNDETSVNGIFQHIYKQYILKHNHILSRDKIDIEINEH